METVNFYAKGRRSGETLHIETDGAIVNLRVGLRDRYGHQVTRVDVSPMDESRSPEPDGSYWHAADPFTGVRVIHGCTPETCGRDRDNPHPYAALLYIAAHAARLAEPDGDDPAWIVGVFSSADVAKRACQADAGEGGGGPPIEWVSDDTETAFWEPGSAPYGYRIIARALDVAESTDEAGALREPGERDDEDEDPGPGEYDGWITLDRDGYSLRLEGVWLPGVYPTREIAIYELAAEMSLTGSFPAAWVTGEHGPATASVDMQVRAHHDAGGTGLLPLPGVQYEPGAPVRYDGEGVWTVQRDYGTGIGMGVMIYAAGDPSVTGHVTDRARLAPIPEDDSTPA